MKPFLTFFLCMQSIALSAVQPPNFLLKGGTLTQARDLYFVRREGGAQYGGKSYEAIIRGDWKLMQNDPFSPLELYNLKTDPQEQKNLAVTNKKVVSELSTALRMHIQRGGSTPWQRPDPAMAPIHR
jgi:arylsulfatase A-like enzyme